jgi:hypothetical protein
MLQISSKNAQASFDLFIFLINLTPQLFLSEFLPL